MYLQMIRLLAAAIALLNPFVDARANGGPPAGECKATCTSKDCLNHANVMLKNMKANVDPCQDFYSFACGGYTERFGKYQTKTVYDDAWHSLQVLIKDLLDNLQPSTGSVSHKMKTMYNTCISGEELSELTGVSDALGYLRDLGIRNWPNLDSNFSFENPDLSEGLGILTSYGEFSFISFKESQYRTKDDDPSERPAALIMPDNVLLNSKLNPKDVESTVFKILDYFGIDRNTSYKMWEEFTAIESLVIKLQNEETENSNKCRDGISNIFTRVNCSEELQDSFKFLCRLWKSALTSGHLERHFSEDIIHISCRWNQYYYIENIFTNLANMTQRSVANYLALRFFIAHLDDTNLYFQLVKKAHSGVRGSKHRSTDTMTRWEYCVAWIIKSMNLALGHEYLKRHLNENIKMSIISTIREYLEELSNEIEKQEWVEERVKAYLKNQLEKLEIGFETSMQNYENETYVENYYNELQPTGESFLLTVLEYQKISIVLNKKRKTHFNGFYSSSDPYTMDFGFALFLPPTYSYGLSKLWNYAALGWVIGHELGHILKFTFDLVQLDENTENNLNDKLDCYFRQYSHFLMDKVGKKLTSTESKEEIMADNIGWSLTEKILHKLLNETKENVILPVHRYTSQQVIYITFAQACCEVMTKEVEQEFYSSKPHHVEKLRVMAVLQNSAAFSETFRCPVNTTMNPVNKCTFF